MPEIRRRRRYEDVVLDTKPVLYLPMQGATATRELVRGILASGGGNATGRQTGPFPGAQSVDFDGNDDSLSLATDASYHPADTFSAGGWFNRLGAGDTGNGGPVLCHFGTGDFTIWFPAGTNAGRLVLRKAGTGDIFATAETNWGTPYTRGWHHVIFTKTGATTKGYVDGVANAGGGTVANQTIVAAASDPAFGLVSPVATATLDFQGRLSHWAVWNRVLTQGDVSDLYRAGRDAN